MRVSLDHVHIFASDLAAKFKYVMIAGPDDLLIELFECREPQRWQLST
ncbi:MAG: hypothetical protein H0T67_11195 [Burkholderiaceae bacterium]|nr:hypothetical protein [Burkholderiaceae bacterium]